jgi:site-specific DNA recombinase
MSISNIKKSAAPKTLNKEQAVKAAIYVRVSTEEQAQSGYSINAQIEKLVGYCRLNGWEIAGQYVDDGYSAKDLQRPNIQRLIADAREKKFNLVLFYKLDRLSRNLKDLKILAEYFKENGIAIKSTTEVFDTSNSSGNLFFNMLGSFAEFERGVIGERTRLGLQRRLKEGKWNGPPPYGYKNRPDGTLAIAEDEAHYIREAYRLFLEHNLGVKLIARRLANEDKTTRRAGHWCPTIVWNLFNRFMLCGYVNIDGQFQKGAHKAIVSEETYNMVQKILKEKAQVPSRRLHSPNILSGIVRCAKCGEVMTTGKGKGHHYYVCSGRSRAQKCDMGYIQARSLESAILAEIKAIAARPEVIGQYLEQHKGKNRGAEKRLAAEKAAIELKVAQLLRLKEKRVNWLLENLPEGEVAAEVSREIKKQLDTIAELKARSEAIGRELQGLEGEGGGPAPIVGFLNSFLEVFNGLETAQKRLMVQGLVKDVQVEGKDRAKAVFTLPIAPQKERPEYLTPVNLLAGTNGSPLRSNWLPGKDSNLRPIG